MALLGFKTATYWEKVKLTELFDREKEGRWMALTVILGSLGLKTVKKTMRTIMTMKIKKIVATIHDARFVLPDGGGLCLLLLCIFDI